MQEEKRHRTVLLSETDPKNTNRRKEVVKAFDTLDEIGQMDEKKGIAATKAAMAEDRRESFRLKSERIEWLSNKVKTARRRTDYFRAVDVIVRYELSFLDLPPGYSVKSEVTERGIKLILRDRWQAVHMGAFAPSGLAIYDEQACRTSVNRLDDEISRLEKNPPSGVYLP